MATPFDDPIGWLAGQLKTSLPVVVTYTVKQSQRDLQITAWLGRTVFASNVQGMARIEFGELDVFLEAADLIAADGVMIEPARGDRIALTLNGTAMILELFTPATAEPAWRYSDQLRKLIRIHCKRVA